MSLIATVTADWLAQRAGADDAARSRQLAAGLAALIPDGDVVVHDLGAGSGAMVKWLAPLLPGPQRWVLHDADAAILEHVDLGDVVDHAGRPVAETIRVGDLASLPAHAFAGASGVVASALLDVITHAEAERIVTACVAAGAPAFFSLTVTGSVRLEPAEPLDQELAAAFDDHQRRDADGRRLLGPDAVAQVAGLFDAHGWNVCTAPTPWQLGRGDRVLIEEWLDGWLAAAVEQRPGLAAAAAGYRDRRLADSSLTVAVSHEDLLAWPG